MATPVLSSPGMGTNLDVGAIVTALVNASIAPKQARHDKNLQSVNAQISDIGRVSSSLSDLQASLSKLSSVSSIYSLKATSSNASFFTASITSSTVATKGAYQVEVKQLAQQQSLATDYIADTNHLGTGTININFGTYNSDNTSFTVNPNASPINVTIPSGSDSLEAVKNAINSAGSSQVTASIVKDDTGSRLTLTSKNTGESYEMQITGSLSALNYDPTTSTTSLTETVAGQNSQVKINGLTLSQSSNQLTAAIPGVTINLLEAKEGTINTLTLTDDQTSLSNSIQDFVTKYNSTLTILNGLTNYNAETKTGGTYQADSQLRNLKSSLSNWISSINNVPNSPIRSLSDLGITTATTGLLQVDQAKLSTALEKNYQYIGGLFAKTATSSDSNVVVQNLTSTVAAGSYAIDLTSYVPGSSITGTIGGLNATSNNGVNLNGSGALMGLSVNILGGSAGARGSITVTDGLAVKLNSFIDSFTNSLTGQFALRKTQLNQEVKQLDNEQERITLQQTQLTNIYTAKYNSLGVLMSQMSSTSTFLTQQLAKLSSN